MNISKQRCNILVCGTLSSGSGAINNLLKEYDNIGHFGGEFNDLRAPGLVADQLRDQSSLNFPNKIELSIQFSNTLKRLIFKSRVWRIFFKLLPKDFWGIDFKSQLNNNIKFKLLELNMLYLLEELNESLKLPTPFEEKRRIANQWIQDIGNTFSPNKDFVLFDQPLFSTIDIAIWTTVFNPFKLVIIYRDPRDQLADIIKRNLLFAQYGSPSVTIASCNIESIYGRERDGAIKFHIDALRNRLKWIDYLESQLEKDKLLLLDFEGLVNKYDDYKTKLEDFISGIRDKHRSKYKYFNPSLSKYNIGIYKKFLIRDDLREIADLEEWYFQKIASNYKKGLMNVM